MSPPRICFVGLENLPALAPEYRDHPMGGAQLQQTLLAKGLARHGWQVSMVVADYGQADGAEWFGVRTHRAYAFGAGLPLLRFITPRWTSVWRAMARADADIYYVSCAGMLLGQVALFAGRHGRKVVFRIAHDTDCQPDKLLIQYWRDRQLYRYGLGRADLILAQSDSQRLAMQANFGRESLVVPSLVEVAEGVRDLRDRDTDALWVSNIRSFKRPDLALELARQNPTVTLSMIGGTQPGSEQYYQQIRDQAAQLPNLVFHGHQRYEAVNQRIGNARVFINTSDSEGFPNTYMQAWARGTPVIAFFDPDGVIAREGLGQVVRSIEEMGSALRGLLSDPPRWQQLSEHCRQYVQSKHGEAAVSAYRQTLERRLAVAT